MSISNYLDPQSHHSQASTSFTYTTPLRCSSPLELTVPVARKDALKKMHYDAVWNSSILLADRIAIEDVEVDGKNILELGAGVGLPGLIACYKGARKVVLTDYDDPSTIKALENSVRECVRNPEIRNRVEVIGHSWGDSIQPLINACPDGFDIILLADVLYEPSSHPLLLKSLANLLLYSPRASIHLVAGYHPERDVVRQFLCSAKLELGLIPKEPVLEISVTGESRIFELVRQEWEVNESHEQKSRWCCVAVLGL